MAAARRPELVRKVLDQFRSTQRVGRFAVKGVRPVDEYNMCAVHLMHEPTKAEVLHFARPDNNNAFAVAFATLPTDDTGAPHILEHTVLCGSKKYPTRDPFFKMLNRSLSNFMNALTGPDYTMYPFSTTNAQDFANLMHVYLDAAFFPNLNELDFCQEGWRLEHENVHDKSSPLQFKGVVFNEMKGAFSSSDNLFCMRASQLLHPHTTFSNVSGGEPIAIPDLTYSDLKAFHHLHYHPSNAKFLTYGDMPLEHHLDIIERDVLQHFSAQEKPTAELLTRPWTAPQQHHIHCAHDPNAGDTQTKMSVSFLTPEATGLYESFVYRMLSSLLLDSASSPFYQALIDSGLAPEYSPNTGLDMHTPQASFSVGVQGIRESAVDDVRTAIDATLQRYTNDPFDDQMVQALLHQIEVRQRAVSANFGLHLVTNVVSGWNHGLDPLDMLEIKPIIERFRREYSQDPMLFQKIIRRDFVENPHRLEVVMTPSKSYQEDLDAKEKEKLNAFVSKLKPADVDAIYDRNLELLASQQKERDVSCLPTLHVEDINRSGTYYDPTITSSQPFDLYTNVQPTNGVCYTRAFFDGAGLSYEDQLFLPLFNQMLTTAGVGDISYKEFPQKVQNCMDGLSASCVVSQDFFNPDKFTHGVNVSSLCLSEHAGDAFSLWQRLLVEARLDDHHHLRNIIRMAAADVVSAIADSGHQYAIGLAASQHSAASRLSDAHGGLAHFKFVKRLNAQLEAGDIKIEDVSARLIAIRDAILKTSNLRAMMIADEDAMSTALPTFTNVFTALDAGTRPEEQQPLVVEAGPYAADNRRAAIVFPFNVSYAGCVVPTVPPSDDASAHLSLATSIMTTFLHREIREKGGAYGAGCGYNAGSVRYMTYRDPTPLRSLEKFAEATEWMLNGGFSDDQVDEAKLTCFQKIDAPVSVGSRGSGFFLSQVPVEAREKRRHAVLDATKEDILNAVETHLAPATVQAASTGLLIPAHMAEAVKETGARVFQGDDDNNNNSKLARVIRHACHGWKHKQTTKGMADVTQCLREALSLPVHHFRVTVFGCVDPQQPSSEAYDTRKRIEHLLGLLYASPSAPQPHDTPGTSHAPAATATTTTTAATSTTKAALQPFPQQQQQQQQQQHHLVEEALGDVPGKEIQSPAQMYGRGKHSVMWRGLAQRPRSRRLPQSAIDRLLLGPDLDTLRAILPRKRPASARSSTASPAHNNSNSSTRRGRSQRPRLVMMSVDDYRAKSPSVVVSMSPPRTSHSPSPPPQQESSHRLSLPREASSTSRHSSLSSSRCASPSEERECRWPHVPLCQHLAAAIQEWALLHAPTTHDDDDDDDVFSAAKYAASQMHEQEELLALGTERDLSPECRSLAPFMHEAFASGDHRRILRAFDRLLCFITIDDVQWFLGMQHTQGTVSGLPPPCCTLLEAFQAPNSPQGPSILTKGARALLKHCHRDHSLSFWGNPTGSEADKNAAALDVLRRILGHSTWLNVHTLPASVHVFEVRTARGYGARWTADGKSFRGFLEPQIPDGHNVGWVH